MDNSLNKKVVKGVSWSFIETLSTYAVRFFIGIILARLLMPADFGLIGMITIFIAISDVFINAGFGQAFIQKKDATQEDANTVFAINFALGLFVYAILFLCAPLIAKFFQQPLLVQLVRVLSLVVIINSLNVIQHALIRKELQFKKRAILTVISSCSSGIIGITCAYHGLGVWSLVFQQLSNRCILCILLYICSKWRLSFKFSKKSATELFSFGSWLLLANLFLSIFNNFYRFIIGKLYSSTQLGLYERAKQFETMIADTFTWVLGTVAFPTFAKLQDDPGALKRATNNFVWYSCLVVFPILACLLVVAKPFIIFLITDKWLPAVPYLQLLCIVGFLTPINFFISPLMQAIGLSKKTFYYTALLGLLRITNVIITHKFGIQGIIIGDFVVVAISTIAMSIYIRPFIGFNYLSVLGRAKGLFLVTIIMLAVGFIIIHYIANWLPLVQILVTAGAMMAIFAGWLLLFERATITKILHLITKK